MLVTEGTISRVLLWILRVFLTVPPTAPSRKSATGGQDRAIQTRKCQATLPVLGIWIRLQNLISFYRTLSGFLTTNSSFHLTKTQKLSHYYFFVISRSEEH